MIGTVLILGANGRFGRNAKDAFKAAGWNIRQFDRKTQDLDTAAWGADVIVNSWNPPYYDWATQVPGLTQNVIRTAQRTGATVIIPGNVYVFGAQTPAPWSARSPHLAKNPLGRIRQEMEAAYKSAGVRTIVLRAGDFIDTQANGNWFDSVMIKSLARGAFTYPGNPDIPHAWAYLPDLAWTAAQLAEKRADLPAFSDLPYAGYTLTGREMAAALSRVTGAQVRLRKFSYLPLYPLIPFWRFARPLIEMKYLWDTPHWLENSDLEAILPNMQTTKLDIALASAIPDRLVQQQIDPDQAMAARG